MSFFSSNDPRRKSLSLSPMCFESLEQRQMLTTLFGGDVFEFTAPNKGTHDPTDYLTVRVSLTGDIIVELIGCDFDDHNNIILGDIPGMLYQSDIGVGGTRILGGIAGGSGSQTMTGVSMPRPADGSTSESWAYNPVENNELINLQGLASRDALAQGDTYAFNVASYDNAAGDTVTAVQLTKIPSLTGNPTATEEANLASPKLDGFIANLTTGAIDGEITGFAINPVTGVAYVVADSPTNGPTLYTVDRDDGTVTLIDVIGLAGVGGNNQAIGGIQAIAFNAAGDLYGITRDYDGDATANASAHMDGETAATPSPAFDAALVKISTATAKFDGATEVFVIKDGGYDVGYDYSAMAFHPDSGVLYAAAVTPSGGTSLQVFGNTTADTVAVTAPKVIKTTEETPADTIIQGLTFANKPSGGWFLLGTDNQATTKLMSIDYQSAAANATILGVLDGPFRGLDSYLVTGDTRTLFGVNTNLGTGVSSLYRGTAMTLTRAAGATVESILGADFMPRTGTVNDGRLFFVCRQANDTARSDLLYSVDVDAGDDISIQNSLKYHGEISNSVDLSVSSIAFEESTTGGAKLYGYQSSDDVAQIIEINPTTGSSSRVGYVTQGGEPLTGITGIEFVADDPLTEAQELYMVTTGDEASLYRFNLNTHQTYLVGSVIDQDDSDIVLGTDGPIAGADLGGLAWQPNYLNPFTGEFGALIGSDVTSDQLVVIDHRDRPPTSDVFAIHISQSSPDASISMGIVPNFDPEDPTAERLLEPFGESVGFIRVTSTDGEEYEAVANGGTGGVYIGGRTEDISSDIDDEDLIPVIIGDLSKEIGAWPSSWDQLPGDDHNDTVAGVTVAASVLEYFTHTTAGLTTLPDLQDRMIGKNFDLVSEMATTSDGTTIVVDSDHIDENGNPVKDQIAEIDNATGQIQGTPASIVDAVTLAPIDGVQGLAYADDGSGDGTQDLYAILNVASNMPVDVGNDDLSILNPASPPPYIAALENPVAITAASAGIVYAIDDANGDDTLYKMHGWEVRTDGTLITMPSREIKNSAGEAITNIKSFEYDSTTGTLYFIGEDPTTSELRLYTLNPSTGETSDGQPLVPGAGVIADYRDFRGLAFVEGTLYAAGWHTADANGTTLFELDIATGDLTNLGKITVGGVDTPEIAEMDVDGSGRLVAVDSDDNRLIFVNLTDATLSIESTSAGSVDADLHGYASDNDGLFYSIMDPGGAAFEEIWVSEGDLPTLGKLVFDAGQNHWLFTEINTLDGGSITGVKAMAFTGNGSDGDTLQDLFVIDSLNQLHQINPANGDIVHTYGEVIDTDKILFDEFGVAIVGSGVINIGSMDFDGEGRLFGHDVGFGRLVTISTEIGGGAWVGYDDPVTPTAGTFESSDASFRPTVGAMSYDGSTQRFLAVDNITGSLATSPGESATLMVVKGNNVSNTDETVEFTQDATQDINNILIGGTVTGEVHISGSINTFYAGWLLTGDVSGLGSGSFPLNFTVGGDILNLIVSDDIGTSGSYLEDEDVTELTYATEFDMHVMGKIGQVWSMGTICGEISAENNDDVGGFTRDAFVNGPVNVLGYTEVESKDSLPDGPESGREDYAFGTLFRLHAGDGRFDNDTIETAQYVGTMRQNGPDDPDQIVIAGLGGTDYFSFGLLGGQTIEILASNIEMLELYDPDGRLIATNQENIDDDFVNTVNDRNTIRLTVDRPGIYTVGAQTDVLYAVTINDVGEVAIGAVRADKDLYNSSGTMVGVQSDHGVNRSGDVGVVKAGNYIISVGGGVDIEVTDGNLRAMTATRIGVTWEGEIKPEDGKPCKVNVHASGDVGLILSSEAITGELDEGAMVLEATVGGNMQVIDAAGELVIEADVDKGIGVIRAGSIVDDDAYINVNRDNDGQDGIIDLIDIEGDLTGLPITTGAGGNVRYMRVGGNIRQTELFGGSNMATTVTLEPGQSLADYYNGLGFVDDSGTTINIAPIDSITGEQSETAQMVLRYFGILGSGGAVLVDITCSTSVEITAYDSGLGNFVEIGKIDLTGAAGQATITNANGDAMLDESGTTLTVEILGNCSVDVLEIVGGEFTSIKNKSGSLDHYGDAGEIVSVTATSIGLLSSRGNIGIARSHTGTVINPRAIVSGGNSYPFVQQHTGIVAGNIGDIVSHKAIGNIISSGTIGRVYANYENTVDHMAELGELDAIGQYHGIVAPILAATRIHSVNIGEGIAPTGSGSVGFAGLFSPGTIGTVRNQGSGSDIYGDIVGTGGVEKIILINGSLIDTNVMTVSLGHNIEDRPEDGWLSGDIGMISITGDGGIIGTYFLAINIGNTTVRGGLGIVNSLYQVTGGGSSIGNITVTSGIIRDVSLENATHVGNVTARGMGSTVPVAELSSALRYSGDADYAYNPLFGFVHRTTNDIHFDLAGGAAPTLTSGYIKKFKLHGMGDMDFLRGYHVEECEIFVTNMFRGVRTVTDMDEFRGSVIRAGRLGSMEIGGNFGSVVAVPDVTVAGQIDRIVVGGDWARARVEAQGPNGNIVYIRIDGEMLSGSVKATGKIGTFIVGGDMHGNLEVTSDGKYAIKTFKVGGSLTGNVIFNGNVGLLDFPQTLGAPGGSLYVTGNLNRLRVGSSRTLVPVSLSLNLTVLGDLKTLDVTGEIVGDILVQGDLGSIIVKSDAASAGTSIIDGTITVLGTLGTVKVTGGDIDGDIIVASDIRSFTITDGDLSATGMVMSSFGNIASFMIRGGDLLGQVLADNGMIGRLSVLGSDLGAASVIRSEELGTMTIDGSILAGAEVTVSGAVKSIKIGQDLVGTVALGSVGTMSIGRDLQGSLTSGYVSRGTRLTVGGDLAGVVDIDADTRLMVRGDTTAASTMLFGRGLTSAKFYGEVGGRLIVDEAIGSFQAASLKSAVVTSGFDIKSFAVRGNVDESFLQAGTSSGEDGTFGTDDLHEDSRMGQISSLTIGGTMTNSVFAAGGDIGRATVSGGMTNSSISSGFAADSDAIAVVYLDATPLGDAAERNAARAGAGRSLFNGDVGSVTVGGTGMVGSYLTAGVDPGDDGVFGVGAGANADNVVTSVTGGQSRFSSVRTVADAASYVLADTGIGRNGITGAGAANTDVDVTYDVNANALSANHALEAVVGVAENPVVGASFVYHGMTITVRGNGQVVVRDGGGDADKIDTLVLIGTDSRTTISIVSDVPGTKSICRILTADDSTVGTLTFDGDITGDNGGDNDDPALWIDGNIKTLAFRAMVDDDTTSGRWNGRIGGDIGSLELETQGAGRLRIGGEARKISITDSVGDVLLVTDAAAPAAGTFDTATSMAIDGVAKWIYDGTNLKDLAGTEDNVVSDAYRGSALVVNGLRGMDFSGGTLYAVVNTTPVSPTVVVSDAISDSADGLRCLTDIGSDTIVGIETSDNRDYLVNYDTTTGVTTRIGQLRDIFNNTYNQEVLAMAYSNSTQKLYALVSDRDGSGTLHSDADGVALVAIATETDGGGKIRVTSPTNDYRAGLFVDGGGETNDFTAMAVKPNGTVYAIRRNGASDELVTLNVTTGNITSTNTVQLPGGVDTDIVGMAFDITNGNKLIAFNNDGASAGMIEISTADGSAIEIVPSGVLDAAIDGFTIGNSGTGYAFDTAGSGSFYKSPGLQQTFGTLDTTNGDFTWWKALEQDDSGTPLESVVVDMAVDANDTGDVFVLTADGNLWRYAIAEGDLVGGVAIGTIVDVNTGEALDIRSFDFDDNDDLVGLDANNGRVVRINKATAAATVLFEAGVVDPDDLTAFASNAAGTTFYAFSNSADNFFGLAGLNQSALAGITVESVGTLTLGGGAQYGGRVVATGNTFKTVKVTGPFNGRVVTVGDINRFSMTGHFGGSLIAGGSIKSVSIKGGDFQVGGSVIARGDLKSLSLSGGNFSGVISAQTAGNVRVSGAALAEARVFVTDMANTIMFNGAFSGQMTLGSAKSITIGGQLASDEASITVNGKTGKLSIKGGTIADSLVLLDGYVRSLQLGGTHAGVIGMRRGVGTVKLAAADTGILSVGLGAKSLKASGDVSNSLFTFGTWMGADNEYNTADDEIFGGSLRSASFSREFEDSVLVAGVLPSLSYGEGFPIDRRAYVGNRGSSDIALQDSAEAGGLLPSTIGRINIRGRVVNSHANTGAMSAIAAADGVGLVKLSHRGSTIACRAYRNSLGVPQGGAGALVILNDSKAEWVFSEELNSSSFVLAQNNTGGSDLTDPSDVLGSVEVMDENGVYCNDVQLGYETRVVAGKTVGVLTFFSPGLFAADKGVTVTIHGRTGADELTIYDRSGLRSALRDPNRDGVSDPNEDPLGTIFDGDDVDQEEGGSVTATRNFP